jgi:hypothetical protein
MVPQQMLWTTVDLRLLVQPYDHNYPMTFACKISTGLMICSDRCKSNSVGRGEVRPEMGELAPATQVVLPVYWWSVHFVRGIKRNPQYNLYTRDYLFEFFTFISLFWSILVGHVSTVRMHPSYRITRPAVISGNSKIERKMKQKFWRLGVPLIFPLVAHEQAHNKGYSSLP